MATSSDLLKWFVAGTAPVFSLQQLPLATPCCQVLQPIAATKFVQDGNSVGKLSHMVDTVRQCHIHSNPPSTKADQSCLVGFW